ncbi:MAG: hypothetical protein H6Q56_348 [Deltaproteobacteria bacterium]|nr:hypothetical protein [Deltaproteobacteria bacterium]
MDFKSVTSRLLTAFAAEQVSYALIGGFAVSLWGHPRATVDMDFLVRQSDMVKVRRIVEGMGYRCIHVSDNVSQFASADKLKGKLDFLHAFRPASLSMLERAALKSIFDGAQHIPVVLPEDLIGLKVQAICNDPSRTSLDMSDIEALVKIFGSSLDWSRIEEYLKLFGMEEKLGNLKEHYDEA